MFNHFACPLPTGGGPGLHVTPDLAGQVRFGPDVGWADAIDYDFDESRRAAFGDPIRRYFPSLQAEWLTRAPTGTLPSSPVPASGLAISCSSPPGSTVFRSSSSCSDSSR